MTDLAKRFLTADELTARALRQAGRELLLAQASDWPFILHTGTSPEYAARRLKDHLLRFLAIHEQVLDGRIDAAWLQTIEEQDNVFPRLDYRHWM
jgi:1,4-alpha-glucan branching enzyme